MDREDILVKFENQAEEIIKEYRKELIKFRIKNNEEITFSIKKTINEIIVKFNEANDNSVHFINFSLLRTSLLENRFEYLLSFHGEQIFYEESYYHEKIGFPYLFDEIMKLKNTLENESKKYLSLVKSGDVDRFIQKNICVFHEFVYNLLGEVLQDIYHWENYGLLKKDTKVKILIGEYHEIPLELIVGGD